MGEVLLNVSVAFVCSVFISLIYRSTYKGTSYSVTYVNSLIAFSMITAIIIMVIGNNLARAFGLVGSMSIIRFRMAIKDTRDIVYIFFSLAIGMATGVGLHAVAITGTLYIGVILFLLSYFNFGQSHRREFLLQFQYYSPEGYDNTTPAYIDIIQKYCKKYSLINIKSLDADNLKELSYFTTLRNNDKNCEFIDQLKKMGGVDNISFYYDDTEQ